MDSLIGVSSTIRRTRLWLLGLLSVLSYTGYAKPFSFPKLSTKSFQIHPFHFSQDALALSMPGDFLSTEEWIQEFIQPQAPALQLDLTPDKDAYNVTFRYNGIPLCKSGLRVKKIHGSGLVSLGSVPTIAEIPHEKVTWNLPEQNGFTEEKSRKCWVPYQKTLKPAWEWTHRQHDGLYKIIADHEIVYDKEPLFFHVTASIQAYETGPVDSNLVTYELETADTGYLDNDYFTVDTGNVDRAFSRDYRFIYEPTEIEFHEASVFAHAEETRLFFAKHGWEWTEETPMLIKIHTTPNNSRNNGLYQPGSAFSDGRARISLGDGDGERLAFLALDADVISHEFGHHVIYRHLKASSREALVLHEGLADAFTFLRTDNNCLGESICPDSSKSICSLPKQCLRSGGTNLTYDSEEYEDLSGDHLRGQVVSGLVWDLKDSVDTDTLIAINLKALEFLYNTSGLKDWLIALMAADQDLNNGTHTCDIYDAALTRGFADLLTNISCSRPDDWPSLNGRLRSSNSASSSGKGNDGSGISCGTIGLPYPAVSFLWFLCPLLVSLLPKRRGRH